MDNYKGNLTVTYHINKLKDFFYKRSIYEYIAIITYNEVVLWLLISNLYVHIKKLPNT